MRCIIIIMLSVFLFMSNPLASFAQAGSGLFEVGKKNIYFVTGCPTPKGTGAYPSSIYTIRSDKGKPSLAPVRMVVPDKWGTEAIHYYYDNRIMVLWQKSVTLPFRIIRMDAPLKETAFGIEYNHDLCSYIDAPLFYSPTHGIFQGLFIACSESYNELIHGKLTTILYGMNFSTMKQEELDWSIYKNIIVSGAAGLSVLSWDSFFFSVPGKDGQLIIPRGRRRINTDWTLPGTISFTKDDLVLACVNNKHMLAITSKNSTEEESGKFGYKTYYILDKKTNSWDSVRFHGVNSSVRAFGPWLARYVVTKAKNGKDILQLGLPEVDYDLKDLYIPGILFLYNVHTKKKYTINTHQPYSGVLLVDGDKVYYRANGSIYMATIGKTAIKDRVLLVEDDVPLTINWAFTTPYYPIEKRPFNSRLKEFYFIGRDLYKWSAYQAIQYRDRLNDIFVYDNTRQEYRPLFAGECYYQKILLSDDEKHIGLLCTDGGAPHNLIVLDTKGEKEFELSEKIEDFVWLPDSGKIIYMTGDAIDYGDRREVTSTGIWLCDIKTGAKKRLAQQGRDLKRTGFDRHVYFNEGGKTVRYNKNTGKVEAARLNLNADYSPDGKYYICHIDENDPGSPIRIVDMTNNRDVFTDRAEFINSKKPVYVEWGKDSHTIIFKCDNGGSDNQRLVYVYDLEAGKTLKTFDGELVGFNGDRTSMVIYQDGKLSIK